MVAGREMLGVQAYALGSGEATCYADYKMGKHEKLYQQIVMRQSDANVPFQGLRGLLQRLGFEERIRGDHHIFTMAGVAEILNLQPREAGRAKPYQVRQVRRVILRYGLRLKD